MSNYSYKEAIMSICTTSHINEELVEEIKESLPKEEVLFDLADFFKVFGDSTRIKIIYLLLKSEMCVCDIAEILSMSQSAISHQLRTLRDAKLVKYRKEGKTVFYSLDDDHVKNVIEQGYSHVTHD
jgi:ArsR family transcriptional regulator